MTKYLSVVLSVIAVGVSIVAYELTAPRWSTEAARPSALLSSDSRNPEVVYTGLRTHTSRSVEEPAAEPEVVSYGSTETLDPVVSRRRGRAVRTVMVEPEPEVETRTVARERRRNWKKTAMVIGGSTAAGAGLGGLMGGKKGALIGAAIGGGASTIYETTKK